MENIAGFLIPIGTIVLIVLVQISFWFQTDTKQQTVDEQATTADVPSSSATAETSVSSSSQESPSSNEATEKKRGRGVRNVVRITPQTIPLENLQCIFISDNKNGDGSFSNNNKASYSDEASNGNGVASNNTTAKGKATIFKCACELGFLSSGVFKTFGNAEAMMRLGLGQCYHKQS
eukprot:jgi/Psemu1/301236/fgenesh1_kg.28_\